MKNLKNWVGFVGCWVVMSGVFGGCTSRSTISSQGTQTQISADVSAAPATENPTATPASIPDQNSATDECIQLKQFNSISECRNNTHAQCVIHQVSKTKGCFQPVGGYEFCSRADRVPAWKYSEWSDWCVDQVGRDSSVWMRSRKALSCDLKGTLVCACAEPVLEERCTYGSTVANANCPKVDREVALCSKPVGKVPVAAGPREAAVNSAIDANRPKLIDERKVVPAIQR